MKILKSIKRFFGYTTLEDKSVQQLLIDDGWTNKSTENDYRFEKSITHKNKEKTTFRLYNRGNTFYFSVKFNLIWFPCESFNKPLTKREVCKIITYTVHLSTYKNNKKN